jgi:hypothetical protein
MLHDHKLNNLSQNGNQPTLANGFGFCLPQKSVLRFKQKLSNRMAQYLKSASDNKIIQAIILRLEKCNEKENLWVAKDLHTADGECFDGRGNYYSCGSRFCSQCVSIPSRRNAKIANYILDKFRHRNLRYIVLTMPDDALSHLSLLQQREVSYHAWRWLTTKSKWWKDNVDGVIRNDEFTVKLHRKNLYHYHGNLLAVFKTSLIPSHLKLKQEVAKALKVAFNHFGYEWHCPTENGLPNVYIKRIVANVKDGKKEISREEVVSELCKYATKPQDWDDVRIEDIEEIAKLERFPRMFEVLGICKTVAKEIRPKPRQIPINSRENVINEGDNYYSNLNAKTYVHTNFITVPKIYPESGHFGRPPPKPKQKSWFRRLRDNEITINQYKIELSFTVKRTIRFRKIQLRQKYPFATFQTLDGQVF